MKIISLGEILWDVFDSRERLGGAPFNFAAHAARLGHEVCFVSAVGNDEHGRRALVEAQRLGVSTEFIGVTSEAPTGRVTVTLKDGAENPDYEIHRPAAYDFVSLDDAQHARLLDPEPDWIYYGTLFQKANRAEDLTRSLIADAPRAQRFYDINLRKNSHTPELIARLLPAATILKINGDEAAELQARLGLSRLSRRAFCEDAVRVYGLRGVCLTRAGDGCSLLLDGAWAEIPGIPVQVRDAVGAGDAFSAAFLHGLDQGWPAFKAGEFANRVGALVASRSGAVPDWTVDEAWALG